MPQYRSPVSMVESHESLYVVAIGASAGGLDALETLFSSLPVDCGAAFVVIQHLSPDHKSVMDSLLARHTSMPVIMVEEDMPIVPNHVFLIPPGAIMQMDGRLLHLSPKNPRSPNLPIDVFFQSLATHHGDHAVGIVLSGTGSDGTRGASALHEAGGWLMAQTPENAKFDGMPRSVIATGVVDAILPIDRMGARIVAHVTQQTWSDQDSESPSPVPVLPMGADAALSGIVHLLLQLGGINFDDYKLGTVMRRIERRMAVQHINSIEAYLDLLHHDRTEVLTLRRELLIPVTSFFRDSESFEALRRLVIHPMVADKAAGQPIRVWCAGVSTGEEAYSIAMLFFEAFDQAKRWPGLKIFATDVEQTNIETAGAGTYPESIRAELASEQLDRFFIKKSNRFVVKSDLRQCIVFARHNVLTDPPFTKMDLVVCRNTLIYFRSNAQDRALRRMQYALGAKGRLFLGSSESLGELQRDFQILSARHKIWQILRSASLPFELSKSHNPHALATHMARRAAPALDREHCEATVVEQGYATLMRAFAPPAAILVNASPVNASHELIHSYGDVQNYLRIREGQASLDLNRILPDELIPVAAALLFKSARENTNAMSDVVRLTLPPHPGQSGGESNRLLLRLSAWPMGHVEGQHLTVLAFEPVLSGDRVDAPVRVNIESETSERITALEHELAATRESLQATIEELETSNEELQSTNEEMMASNEALQSSNEELQSVNEELNTVNAEHQKKIDVLNRLNADLDNLARVVSSGTVFVDHRLNLTRFSAAAAHIFRLRDTDIGRPLEDLNHTLDYPEFMSDLRQTLAQGVPFEKDVSGPLARHYLIKMQPYRVPSSSTREVAVSFVDMTSAYQVTQLQTILDGLSEQIAVLDLQGTITLVNRAWRRFAHDNGASELRHCGPGTNYLVACEAGMAASADEVSGLEPPMGLSDAEYARRAVHGLRSVLNGEVPQFRMEYPCHSPGCQRWFVMSASPLYHHSPAHNVRGAVVSHIDITGWRRHNESDAIALSRPFLERNSPP